jgi:CubicO group peptidase (beta-lactamase class C family)
MRMRGGIAYVAPLSNFLGTQLSNRIRSDQEMISTIAGLDLEFQPGDKFSYSNLGYSLLGVIVGRVNRSSWSEAVHKRIFEPFGMKHSAVEGEDPRPPEYLAAGLLSFKVFSKQLFMKLPHWNYSMIKGAGGIVTTVGDLNIWNNTLSKKEENDPNWGATYFPRGLPSEENYSYGWFLSENSIDGDHKITTINHGGEDPGYCATAIRLPSLKAHLIVTLNSDYCLLKEGALKPLTKQILKHLTSSRE